MDNNYLGNPNLKRANVKQEWTKENLKFFVDGDHYFTYEPKNKTPKNWPYVNDQFIILNIAMGGNLGGSIDPNFSKDQMEIDFVRVYQQK